MMVTNWGRIRADRRSRIPPDKLHELWQIKFTATLKQVRTTDQKRTGTFTTGIISTREAIQIALYFTSNITGENHSGENMKQLLQQRSPDLPELIQMSDALSRNFSELEVGEVIECCCLTAAAISWRS